MRRRGGGGRSSARASIAIDISLRLNPIPRAELYGKGGETAAEQAPAKRGEGSEGGQALLAVENNGNVCTEGRQNAQKPGREARALALDRLAHAAGGGAELPQRRLAAGCTSCSHVYDHSSLAGSPLLAKRVLRLGAALWNSLDQVSAQKVPGICTCMSSEGTAEWCRSRCR